MSDLNFLNVVASGVMAHLKAAKNLISDVQVAYDIDEYYEEKERDGD